MAVRHDITRWLREGLSPLQIKKERLKPGADIVRLVLWEVGESKLQLSEVFFSIPRERQAQYEGILDRLPGRGMRSWQSSCTARRLDVDEFTLYALSKDSRPGDMYGHLRALEVGLHGLVRDVLEHAFCTHDDAWWREGVPLNIRRGCAITKEEDPQPMSELYAYTKLIHLKTIIDKQWKVFEKVLPKEFSSKKKLLMERFDRLNAIRNGVMHPIKPIEITQEDFTFVREMRQALSAENW
jgi:hypothetical protein